MDFFCHAIRIQPGEDLLKTLLCFVKSKTVSSAFILTCVGSLSQVKLRLAGVDRHNKMQFLQLTEELEIVSLVGTISESGKPHLHISVSDNQGNVFGGHLPSDGTAVVRTTAEIVVGLSKELKFKREFDDKTGFDELIVTEQKIH